MFRRFSANFALFSMLLDAVMVAITLYVSAYLRVDISAWPLVKEIPDPVRLPGALFLFLPGIWVSVLALFNVYDGRKNLKIADELGSLAGGSLLAMISMAGMLFLTFREMSRFLFLFFAVEAYLMLVFWRLVYRLAYRYKMIGQALLRRVLIVGAGTVGRNIQKQVEAEGKGTLVMVGLLDDDPAKLRLPGVCGTTADARAVVARERIDDVVVALPRSAYDRLNQVVGELHDLPVRVWVVPDYFSLSLHQARVEELAGIPLLDLRAPALSEYQRMVKRAFDLVVCLAGLPFALPVMALIALLIKLDSKGPVFYRQMRAGENGRLFEMIKFRTMVVNADQMRSLVEKVDANGNLIHKSKDDPRVTRFGKFLRHTSMDEIPQIINILNGEMSLVGPRPEMPYLVEKYDLWQRKRFAVPQGLTGWWQINGRSDRPMHLNTEDDLYYVQHYSLWLDLKILFRTVWSVLKGRGAF
jgi:exopolysaccharide biosynthesis polyprenyl glycosylphosphotransferase